MRRAPVILIAFGWSSSLAIGCGLGWTLPTSHFNGVEEHGYVSYWEKIGQVDLGDGLIVPININFNSHRESSSPTLGKGWMVALLESHVEPIDENSMKVVMPDGWNYYFHRNGNTETWAGNAGWVGETNNTLFTITAPCGGKIKFDGGKIQEIDTNKNRTLAYKYNGPVATEVDIDGKPFVQVESNATTEASEDLLIGGQKLEISESQRPQVLTKLNQNFIVGFDQSLSQLQWQDGRRESFAFSTDKSLNPTLTVTPSNREPRNFTWDTASQQIKTDGTWSYSITPWNATQALLIKRSRQADKFESFVNDDEQGNTIETFEDGRVLTTYRFTSGLLYGRTRKIVETRDSKLTRSIAFTYNESGNLIRKLDSLNGKYDYVYDKVTGQIAIGTLNGHVIVAREYDSLGRMVKDVLFGREYDYIYPESQMFPKALSNFAGIDPSNILVIRKLTLNGVSNYFVTQKKESE
jgi:hypothetical protein